MEEYLNWFVECVHRLKIEDIRQIARLIKWYESSQEELGNAQYDASLNAAMLADICEAIFGGLATRAPSLLSYPHSGWACGPGVKAADEKSYVSAFFGLRKSTDKSEKIKEWETFIKTMDSVEKETN